MKKVRIVVIVAILLVAVCLFTCVRYNATLEKNSAIRCANGGSDG